MTISFNQLTGVMLSASGLGNVLLLGVITLIIEKIGEANLLVVNLMLFGLRAVIYYFLQSVKLFFFVYFSYK